MLVIVVVVVFAFWRPLFAGATLAPVDQLWSVEPFVSETVGTVLSEAAPPGCCGNPRRLGRSGVGVAQR